jgi:hypothetical protein
MPGIRRQRSMHFGLKPTVSQKSRLRTINNQCFQPSIGSVT